MRFLQFFFSITIESPSVITISPFSLWYKSHSIFQVCVLFDKNYCLTSIVKSNKISEIRVILKNDYLSINQ